MACLPADLAIYIINLVEIKVFGLKGDDDETLKHKAIWEQARARTFKFSFEEYSDASGSGKGDLDMHAIPDMAPAAAAVPKKVDDDAVPATV